MDNGSDEFNRGYACGLQIKVKLQEYIFLLYRLVNFQDRMFIVGGKSGRNRFFTEIVERTFVTRQNLPFDFSYGRCIGLQSNGLACAGDSADKECWTLNESDLTWSNISSLVNRHHGGDLAPYQNSVVMIGLILIRIINVCKQFD